MRLRTLSAAVTATAALLALGSAPAHANMRGWTGQTSSCAALTGTDGSVGAGCLQPSVQTLERNDANCPGNDQYFPATDGYGKPIQWTYSNGSHACIKVSYSTPFPITLGDCEYWFYAPAGHATGTIYFGYWVGGAKHIFALNENPVEGWRPLFTDFQNGVFGVNQQPTRIEFQDNNGQTGNQIAWGANNQYGIIQTCYGAG